MNCSRMDDLFSSRNRTDIAISDIAISDRYCDIGTKIRRPNFWTVRISTQMDDLFSSRNRIYYIRVCAILRLRNIYYSLSSLSSSCSSPLSPYSKTLSAADYQSNWCSDVVSHSNSSTSSSLFVSWTGATGAAAAAESPLFDATTLERW